MPLVRISSRLSAVVLPALLFLLCSSCAVTDFVGTYFNTYYNAQRLFSEAEDEIWAMPEAKFSGRSLLLTLNPSGAVRQKLATVIEKCSKLLQYHQNSKLVDNALLMITKAFYYQGDYARAERKCRELLAAYPESDLVLKTKMYLAYSLYKQSIQDSAVVYGQDVLEVARTDGDDETEAYAAVLLAQIQQERKNYAAARELYDRAAVRSTTPEFRVNTLLIVADMCAQISDSLNALEAYVLAAEESKGYLSEYKALIGQVRMLIKLGRAKEAVILCDRLRRNTNFRESWGEIDEESANAMRSEGSMDEAIARYIYVDTSYARTEYSANADYELGRLYEKEGLFDSARVWYTRGGRYASSSGIGPALAQRAELFTRHQSIWAAIHLYDSLRAGWYRQRDSAVSFPALALRDTLSPRQDSAVNVAVAKMRDTLSLRKDSVRALAKPVAPQIPIDTITSRLANAYNELGTLFYTGIQIPDSALAWFDTLLTRFPKSPHTPRVWYTRAQISSRRDSTGGKSVADSLYHRIVDDYPLSAFAVVARRLLGLPPIEVTVDPAEEAYKQAERLMLDSSYQAAADSFVMLARTYTVSPLGSRAQYAAGWIYEQKLMLPDSALSVYRRLLKGFPQSTYAQLVKPKVDEADQAKSAPPPPPAAGTNPTPSATPTSLPPPGVSNEKPPSTQPTPSLFRKPAALDSLHVPTALPGRAKDSTGTSRD